MIVGSLRLVLRLHGCSSLKEKRALRLSLSKRIRNKFELAVAEVDSQDSWDRLVLGVAAVGSARRPVEEVLRKVADFAEQSAVGELLEDVIEIDHR